MNGISLTVGGWGGDDIGGVGRLLGFAEKPSIANGKKHVELDNTKKVRSIILAPTDLCHPLPKTSGTTTCADSSGCAT